MTHKDDSMKMDLTGQLLVAMPGMGDPRFDHSVIFICSHDDEGAMGLIVNKPAADLKLDDVLDRLSDVDMDDVSGLGVHVGGPVETERGFVLHSAEYRSVMQTTDIADGVAMTATLDILEDIARGKGPRRAMLMLGYAGWAAGQLEAEIAQNGWLTCQGDSAILFDLPDARKWEAALTSIGVDPLGLSATAGRA
ncbi:MULTISPECIES: YqgE/AlgH family protein [Sulfitobacter]|jgi:putative transcriptional regulator|uniref:YqgE/AlgH family protein n=2 Tax=Roseobacteraceae TaxID=2854170 RepID=UPI00241E511C|nr:MULTISPECIES: YqgE/AlgH family protein [Sulfitobacter]|tara:strand:- start:1596 stop:2177 length:582 start_codon:yes stop_codon:yes gene_type:complete